MSPVIFEWGPLQIRWYGLLFAMGVLLGVYIIAVFGRRFQLHPEALDHFTIRLIITVIVGARLGYVLVNWGIYRQDPVRILFLHQGGFGSHGGIILAMVMGYFFTRRLSLPYWTTADAVAPVIPMGHIFIRLGNFINGELYGPPTTQPWGVSFPGTAVPHHPSQLYEALASLLLLPLVFYLAKQRSFEGALFLTVIILQSLIRLVIDFFRQNTPQVLGPFILTQVISILLILFATGLFFYKKRRS